MLRCVNQFASICVLWKSLKLETCFWNPACHSSLHAYFIITKLCFLNGEILLVSKSWVGFPDCTLVKNPAANARNMGFIPGWEDPLENGMATHSSILAWKVLRTGGGLSIKLSSISNLKVVSSSGNLSAISCLHRSYVINFIPHTCKETKTIPILQHSLN